MRKKGRVPLRQTRLHTLLRRFDILGPLGSTEESGRRDNMYYFLETCVFSRIFQTGMVEDTRITEVSAAEMTKVRVEVAAFRVERSTDYCIVH